MILRWKGRYASVVMERFTIERTVGDIPLDISFNAVVGTGSRSQCESDE